MIVFKITDSKYVAGYRFAVIVSLAEVTTFLADETVLFGGFNSLGNHLQVQAAGDGYNAPDQLLILDIIDGIGDETAVNL